ncbi:amino acid adenylation domain-containing protein [Bradyrhizobium sp. ORS 86]|uniref:amino acid adenylation domain-containing protein n=1 Tax=Bradyrhizobium sp. ORS 86 TaxID=1685970 RepID=UPI00388EE3C5
MDFGQSNFDHSGLRPLTQGQHSIWLAQALDPSDPAFNIGECVEIHGAVDSTVFERALRQAVKEAAGLHLRISETLDGPRQYLVQDDNWELPFVDFGQRNEPRSAAEAWMRADMNRAFDLTRESLFRFALLRIASDRYCWYAVNHHLVNDGYGWVLLLRRVAELYGELAAGISSEPRSFGSLNDLIEAEEAYRQSQQYVRDQSYWSDILKDRPEPVSLSTYTVPPNPGVLQIQGFVPSHADLEALGRTHGASAAAVVMAAVALYFYRMTGARDLVMGMQVAARLGHHSKRAVGMAANVIPLRLSVHPDEDFNAHLHRTARAIREAFRHQLYRIEDLRRDFGLSPRGADIFSVFANYMPLDESITFAGFAIRRLPLGNWRVDDIQFVYYGSSPNTGHRIDVVGNSARYTLGQLDEHLQRLCALIDQCTVRPDTIGSQADLISDAERARILIGFNDPGQALPLNKFVHELFEERVSATPEAPAVLGENASLTYSELNIQANRLAHYLRAEGAGPEVLVAICSDQPVQMVVALLGTLKAGAACVPIDPALGKDQLERVLQDISPSIVLAGERALLPKSTTRAIVIEEISHALAQLPETNIDVEAVGLSQGCLAYVTVAPDQTGITKALMEEHIGVLGRLLGMQREYPLMSSDCVVRDGSLGSPRSIWQLLWPLTTGAKLVVTGQQGDIEPEYLKRVIDGFEVTTTLLCPSALPSLLNCGGIEACGSLRRIFCSGEPISSPLAARCLQLLPEAQLHSLYAPTESDLEVAHWPYDATALPGKVPIGRPLANAHIYVLDRSMRPVPVGGAGEIYIGGPGVPRGYLGQPELTAQRFVECPFDLPNQGKRLYKTGDYGRWGPDGVAEFLGRSDLQIRHQGVLIDLHRIETCLSQIAGVKEAAVIVCENSSSEPGLLAYFTERQPSSSASALRAQIQAIQSELERALPPQWWPSSYVAIAALPLSAGGKPDRGALAARGWPKDSADIAPQGPTEVALHAIWQEVLRIEHFGRRDSFFDLGGHSLLATQVASRVSRVFNVELPLHTIFETQTLENLARRIEQARDENRQIPISPIVAAGRASEHFSSNIGEGPTRITPATTQSIEEHPTALSYSQQRMWLIQSLDPQNSAYNLSGAVRLIGPLHREALSGALNEVCRRHENLRSTFREVDGEVQQQVEPWRPQELLVTDLRSLGDAAPAEAIARAQRDARTPIDLTCGPVLRASLFRIADDEHLLHLTLHHISGDQWSVGIVARELASAYNDLRAGRPVNLEPVRLRYQDYAKWQRAHENHSDDQLSYWKRQLDQLPSIELPTDFSRPQVRGLNGASHRASVDAALLSKLDRMSKREGCTLFMTMLAAFAVQLYRLTGQEDFAIGVPIANRTQSDLENLVGTFVNTLALRVDLSERPSFLAFLKRVRGAALDAYARQDVPFDRLVQEIAQSRDNSRAPLVQVMFNMLNTPFYGVSFDGLKWEPAVIDRGGAQFELSLSVDAQLSNTVTFEYNTDLFERRTVERFSAQYLQLLESIANDPDQGIGSMPMLPASERRLLLDCWNATLVPADRPRFIAMFEEQVARRPNASAVTFDGKTISYADLDASASLVAKNLHTLGVRPNAGVALCLKRSIDLIVMLLGVQKAGGYYVPLDPSFPAKRLAYMLADSGVTALVTDPESKERLTVPDGLRVYDSATLMRDGGEMIAAHPVTGSSDGKIAYIIYTSGSTGQPKGVVISHDSLSNFLLSMSRVPGLTRDDVMIAVTTVSFDIAGLELYLPLSVGASIELVSRESASNAATLSSLLQKSRATVMQATPATWRMLIDGGWKGDGNLRALCGGEALSRDLADALLARVGELWNLYGPTETTIWSTVARIERGDAPISIGRPIDNTRVYIVDHDGELAPIGVSGEILIAGAGVAVGYQDRPEATAERFLPDRFNVQRNERVYRTGDLGKWNADGLLHHLGRIDSQIKVRGFRIETGEIETVLRQQASVTEAVVVARELTPGDSRLVAYVIHKAEVATVSELRAQLRDHLPDYMIPSLIVPVDAIPLTPNGKVDRKALPDPFTSQMHASTDYVEPAAGTEQLIANVWRDLLRVERISADDNFFELGGHSLLAVRMVGIVRQKMGRTLDPRTLYFKNLRQIAEFVAEGTA